MVMSQSQPRKLFSVERRALERQGLMTTEAQASSAPIAADSLPVEEILTELRALRAEVAEIKETSAATATATSATPSTLDEDAEMDIRLEIAQMVRVIGRAKSEIASIKHPLATEDQVDIAATQLETIVRTTEQATNDIMTATDATDAILKKIHALTIDDQDVQDHLEEAAAELITIIESCSFQDITGQRITEVIKTLRFIESKILSMIDLWGGLEAFQDLPMPAGPEAASGDDGLLNGPAMEGQGLSQDDIDALFD
jgi:chemotaxis protein CheZ